MTARVRLQLPAAVVLLAAATGTATASPPLPSDVALILTVASAAPHPLRPGSTGVLSLRVENRYPHVVLFTLDTARSPVSAASPPIRLFALPDAPEAACGLQQVDDRPFVPGRYWFMTGGLAIGGAVTCRIGFEILPAAQSPGRLEFLAQAFNGLSAGYVDLTPEDNLAELPFGQPAPARPVPAGQPSGLAALVLALVLAGLLGRHRRARD
jgi:hypothetical protein